MRPIFLLILTGVAASATPGVLKSQLAAASAGSRVRVTAPTVQKRPIVGLLSTPIGDSVVIALAAGSSADARRLSVPAPSIVTLEVSLGRSSSAGRALGVKVGALLALGLGAFFGVAVMFDRDLDWGIGGAVGIGALATFATILPLMAGGAVIGSIVRKEKWRRLYPVSQ